VTAAGRQPRRRFADLLIASIAVAEGLPLLTRNPDDFAGLVEILVVVPV
jgi:predicted nucleic acid-binding protein